MIPSITMKVNTRVQSALRRLIAAKSPEAMFSNFTKVVEFALKEVRNHTPGEHLSSGWDYHIELERDGGDWTMKGRIFNRFMDERLWYLAAISGERKPKLKTYPSNEQQTYADILPILDAGSRPHEITPKRYKALAFRISKSPPAGSKDHANLVVTTHVDHPGTKAYGMLSITRRKLKVLLRSAVVTAKEQVIKAWD